jgi:hypothetical protein
MAIKKALYWRQPSFFFYFWFSIDFIFLVLVFNKVPSFTHLDLKDVLFFHELLFSAC